MNESASGEVAKDHEPWQFVRLVRQPSGFGVAMMTVRHKDKGSVVVPLMLSDLHALATAALDAMNPANHIGGSQ